MCIPGANEQALPPTSIPSMAAADALKFGGSGAPSGAALLGRDKLKLSGKGPAVAPIKKATTGPASADTQGADRPSNVLGFAQSTSGGDFQYSPNGDLRIPTT